MIGPHPNPPPRSEGGGRGENCMREQIFLVPSLACGGGLGWGGEIEEI